MIEWIDVPILLIAGFLGGILAGMLGIGGGLVYVVAFNIYLTKLDLSSVDLVKLLVANSVFAVFFAGLSASIKQFRQSNFFIKETLITAFPGVVGALSAALSIVYLDWYSKQKFTIIFVTLMLFLLYKMVRQSELKEDANVKEHLPFWKYGLSGFFSGLLSALSGLGGGVVMIPILSGMQKLRMSKAASISLGIMPIYTFAMSVFYFFTNAPLSLQVPYSFGYIIFPMAVPMAVGVVAGAPYGVKIAQKSSPTTIKWTFVTMIVAAVAKMILF